MLHAPSARPWSRGGATPTMIPGAATATVTSPRPERTRDASRAALESAVAPQTDPATRKTSPAASTRRAPSRSAASPLAIPRVAPMRLKIEATQPPATRPRPSSSRKAGSAGGTLPTCSEAATPLAIMTLTTTHRVAVARSGGGPPCEPPARSGGATSRWERGPGSGVRRLAIEANGRGGLTSRRARCSRCFERDADEAACDGGMASRGARRSRCFERDADKSARDGGTTPRRPPRSRSPSGTRGTSAQPIRSRAGWRRCQSVVFW